MTTGQATPSNGPKTVSLLFVAVLTGIARQGTFRVYN